jgi:hypothetical protein
VTWQIDPILGGMRLSAPRTCVFSNDKKMPATPQTMGSSPLQHGKSITLRRRGLENFTVLVAIWNVSNWPSCRRYVYNRTKTGLIGKCHSLNFYWRGTRSALGGAKADVSGRNRPFATVRTVKFVVFP